MQYLALYRKYRPDNFDDIVGQNYVIKTLKNEIVNNKLSHAYLFYGPRGTGKTTMAKTISKLINCSNLNNCRPCEKCDSCIAFNEKNNPDIVEIDAASNNGVDEIRTIRDNVNLMPLISRYKVYIIDEVHMLSSGAFNALLKTLEEPPKHVIFVLATTEFYKVPETIVSRCQAFEFERISTINIVNKLRFIADQEKISVDDNILNLIAKYSNGGMRDAINMLDKLASFSKKIMVDDFYELKGISNRDDFLLIVDSLFRGDSSIVLKKLDDLIANGKSLSIFIDDLIEYFKNIVIGNIKIEYDVDFNLIYEVLDILLKIQLDIKLVENQIVVIEIGILKILRLLSNHNKIISREIILKEKCCENTKIETKATNNVNNYQLDIKKIDNMKNNNNTNINAVCVNMNSIRINNAFATANKEKLKEFKTKWLNFSDYLYDDKYSNVVSYLIDGDLRVVGDNVVIISVKYDSILENANKNLNQITELFDLVVRGTYKICFISNNEWNQLKLKYISDVKHGIVYKWIEEKSVVDNSASNNNADDSYSKIVNSAISLFGNDIIEVK